jgi:hypothetical protein
MRCHSRLDSERNATLNPETNQTKLDYLSIDPFGEATGRAALCWIIFVVSRVAHHLGRRATAAKGCHTTILEFPIWAAPTLWDNIALSNLATGGQNVGIRYTFGDSLARR